MRRPKPNKSARGAETGLAGRAEEHIFPVRVYYEDTDASDAGRPDDRPGANGAAGLDDQLEVRTRLSGVGGASIEMEQRIVRARRSCARGAHDDDGIEAVGLVLTLACLTAAGKPARIPAYIRTQLAGRRLHDVNDPER
jgi:acyl-CoA thioesterase FadM